MDNALSMLGLAKKAGFLEIGEESVRIAAAGRAACLIISAGDSSDSSKRHAVFAAESCGAVYIEAPYSKFELGNLLGRGSPGTLAVTDLGIAASFASKLAENDPNRFGDTAAGLEDEAKKELARIKQARLRKTNTRAGKRRT